MIGGSGVASRIAKSEIENAFSLLDLLREPHKYEQMLSELRTLLEANREAADRIGTAEQVSRALANAKRTLEDAKLQASELENVARKKLSEGESNLTLAWNRVKAREAELDHLVNEEKERLDKFKIELDNRHESLSRWESTLHQMETDLHSGRRHIEELKKTYEDKCSKLAEAMR